MPMTPNMNLAITFSGSIGETSFVADESPTVRTLEVITDSLSVGFDDCASEK